MLDRDSLNSYWSTADGAVAWPPGHVIGWEHTFIHENCEFLTAVADGEEYHPSFQDGLIVQEIMEAVEESDDRGEWVSV